MPHKKIASLGPGVEDLGGPRTPNLGLWHRLEERWNRLQVGRQGSYSVERLESLDHYCNTASPTRVLLVCVLTPIPALTFALLLECLPLRPPSEGWAANWMFWVRLSLMVFGLTFVGISELLLFLPNFEFPVTKRLIVAGGTAIGFVGTCVLSTATGIVGFPIPFLWQFGGIFLGIYVTVMVLLVCGLAPFIKDSPLRSYLQRFIRLFLGYAALTGVFPLYKVLYELVPVVFRMGALVALPLWKFAAKHFMVWSSRELEDIVPVIVSLTVDFLSALFVSVCISTSGPLYLSFLFIAIDLAQMAVEFREVKENATAVLKFLQTSFNSIQEEIDPKNSSEKPDLLAKMTAVTRNPAAFDVESFKHTRLWACLPHTMAIDQATQLAVLEASALYGPRGLLSTTTTSRSRQKNHQQFRMSASIVPELTTVVPKKRSRSVRSAKAMATNAKKRGETSRQLVVQGLQMLFHCEYLALVEYIECVVPLVFVTYKLVLRRLPNAIYYPDTRGNWGLAALMNILVFAGLEVGSLLLLHHFLQRKFQFSPLHQLAFALESQMYLVQASLFLEIVVLLQFELAHLGKYLSSLHYEGCQVKFSFFVNVHRCFSLRMAPQDLALNALQ